jgi:hypothetical protein
LVLQTGPCSFQKLRIRPWRIPLVLPLSSFLSGPFLLHRQHSSISHPTDPISLSSSTGSAQTVAARAVRIARLWAAVAAARWAQARAGAWLSWAQAQASAGKRRLPAAGGPGACGSAWSGPSGVRLARASGGAGRGRAGAVSGGRPRRGAGAVQAGSDGPGRVRAHGERQAGSQARACGLAGAWASAVRSAGGRAAASSVQAGDGKSERGARRGARRGQSVRPRRARGSQRRRRLRCVRRGLDASAGDAAGASTGAAQVGPGGGEQGRLEHSDRARRARLAARLVSHPIYKEHKSSNHICAGVSGGGIGSG